MALLCSVCVWHAIVPLIHSRLVDLLVLATFGCVYLISHLAFYIFIDVVVSNRRHRRKERGAMPPPPRAGFNRYAKYAVA